MYHGSSGVVGLDQWRLVGLDQWRLVRFSVEIGEFLGGMGSFGFGCWVWVLLGLN